MSFYDDAQKKCVENGISMSYMCDKLGMSRGNITHWKNGKEPTIATKTLVEKYFETADFTKPNLSRVEGRLAILEEVKTRPEVKVLMHSAEDASIEDILKTVLYLEELKKKNGNGTQNDN